MSHMHRYSLDIDYIFKFYFRMITSIEFYMLALATCHICSHMTSTWPKWKRKLDH